MLETDLIEASNAGNFNAFEKLIKMYESRVYNFFVKMCNDQNIAEDMMQETFINVYKNLKHFKGNSKFSTWMFQIAINNCLIHKRKNQTEVLGLDDNRYVVEPIFQIKTIDAWQFDPAILYEKKELKDKLNESLQKLPSIYRSVFVLKDIEGFKAQEIAEILSISLANVKARILRARFMLKDLLSEVFFKS